MPLELNYPSWGKGKDEAQYKNIAMIAGSDQGLVPNQVMSIDPDDLTRYKQQYNSMNWKPKTQLLFIAQSIESRKRFVQHSNKKIVKCQKICWNYY